MPPTVRIATYSMLPNAETLPTRRPLIRAGIEQAAPDILCLQNVCFSSQAHDAMETLGPLTDPDLTVAIASSSTPKPGQSPEGNAILTRHPVQRFGTWHLPGKSANGDNHCAVWAITVSPAGTHYMTVCTQLACGAVESTRAAQLRHLVDNITHVHKSYPHPLTTILAGDLNLTPAHDSYRWLSGQTATGNDTLWTDTYLAANGAHPITSTPANFWAAVGANAGRAEPAQLPERTLDYIWVHGWAHGTDGYPTASALHWNTSDTEGSDRYGLVTDLYQSGCRQAGGRG